MAQQLYIREHFHPHRMLSCMSAVSLAQAPPEDGSSITSKDDGKSGFWKISTVKKTPFQVEFNKGFSFCLLLGRLSEHVEIEEKENMDEICSCQSLMS
ncbi:hypothetical protein P7K49_002317 [Saguinus oedipus]|uniref:Uncharacterized protein n=1 Tax=Saguinus oedipus TaxID=9490 RepID=A0ABQ9WH05_SAGOE|nr:hypothetical protein P7K49_002317 [Saguinus oedipus]